MTTDIGKTSAKAVMAACAAMTLGLAGCAGSYGANTVNPNSVGYAAQVREGTVTAVREVQIKDDRNYVGAGVGAALGGLAGSELGGGRKAQTAGAIGGAVLGGLAGNEVGKTLNSRKAYAYTVRFDNGEVVEIIQGADTYVQPGTRVEVAYRGDRTTVTPIYY